MWDVGYRLSVIWRCLAAALGGALLAGAFEPLGWALLLPGGMAVLFLSTYGLPPRRAWVVSLVFGVTFLYLVMYWMRGSVGTDAWLAMCGVLSLSFIPLGWGLAHSYRTRWWPVLAAVWWVGLESLRGVFPFSGMPFGRLAFATADTVWEAALPWVGMTGVSLLVALSGATVSWALLNVRAQPAAVGWGLAGLGALTALPHAVAWDGTPRGTVEVALVQGNVPGEGTDVVGNHREITANHVRLSEQLAREVDEGARPRPDFVVWPENATAVDPFRDPTTAEGIRSASTALGAPLLVGAMVDGPDERTVLNQGIVWTPGRGAGERYTKQHPVPYGEYIPFRDTLIPSDYGKLRTISRDMAAGDRETPLRIAGTLVADAICFDVAYDDSIAAQVRNGAELITVQTSNAMFIKTAQVDQQFEISRLRAVEARRGVVVAALNGISGIIGPDGEVLTTAARGSEAILQSQVPLAATVTPATAVGQWPARIAATALVGHVVLIAVFYRGRVRRVRRVTMSKAEETVHR